MATDHEGNRYEFPEMKADLSTENKVCNGIEAVVSESREAMLSEVEGLDNNSQSILNSVPYHQGVRKACAGMRAQLNPQLAKDQEREKEMQQLRTDIGATAVCVAHHQDDSVETVLMNLLEEQ